MPDWKWECKKVYKSRVTVFKKVFYDKIKNKGTLNYGIQKKEVYRIKPMAEGKRKIIRALLQEDDIETADDI